MIDTRFDSEAKQMEKNSTFTVTTQEKCTGRTILQDMDAGSSIKFIANYYDHTVISFNNVALFLVACVTKIATATAVAIFFDTTFYGTIISII